MSLNRGIAQQIMVTVYSYQRDCVAISSDATEEYCHAATLIMVFCFVFFMALLIYISPTIKFTLIMYFRWEKRKLTKWYHSVVEISVIMKTVHKCTRRQTPTRESLLER